ncbi:class I SAM-dependent methyltransferase [Streptomyces sp. LN245]|uniref:class I SAM-dependent methyltransferase n=1 Tax=Streptomyces sp. LN245 TaxID=3112975 RepID=UPI00371F6BEF
MTVQHDTHTLPELTASLRESAYLPTMTLDAYRRRVAAAGPLLRSVLDFERPGADAALRELAYTVTEFDSDGTGRGDSYRRAQRSTMVRWTGMRQILRLASPSAPRRVCTVLDVLGGDGTIARAVGRAADATLPHMSVLTGDVSGTMVERALEQGLPAVRQSADFLFLRDNSVDATLLSYGTHHIAPEDRPTAVAEAVRVTRGGGRVLVHDFDESSPMARFFTEVVHPCSTAGHDYRHFSRPLLTALFDGAGTDVSVLDLYDPLTVVADSEEQARQDMCDHLRDMYGIHAFFDGHEDTRAAWNSLVRLFDHTDYLATTALRESESVPTAPVIRRTGSRFVAEVPRVALLAVGSTPFRS